MILNIQNNAIYAETVFQVVCVRVEVNIQQIDITNLKSVGREYDLSNLRNRI